MKCHRLSNTDAHLEPGPSKRRSRLKGFWRRWFFANTAISGFLALCWLLLRSGTKPSRLTYPCQQAAISAATLAFGVPLVASAIAARQRLTSWARSPARLAGVGLGLLFTLGFWGYLSQAEEYSGPVLSAPLSYRADLFHVTECPQDPALDRFVGLDNLILTMGRGGLKFYRSPNTSTVAGPDGVIDSDDVIVIKINYQWGQRGGTNVDLLRGLVRRILDHPDSFVGEIVVCENAQFNSVVNFDRSQNNAQDHGLSPHDVVLWFQDQGHNISHYDWTSIRYTSVDEYSMGDMADGYFVYDYDPQLHGRISYPKFQTDAGTYISLKHGVWDPVGETYDPARLRFINLPVLKSHHAVYGATISVKNYMGVVTRELSTSSHSAIKYGIMGALLGETQLADLNIVDAIWINANPNSGPATSYAGATRRDELAASLDPVALDIWTVKNILIPGFLGNGYSPPWPFPSADPDDPASEFREYLDNSMYQILDAGYEVTNDLAQIDVHSGYGAAGDYNGDGDVDADDYTQFSLCFTGEGGGPVAPGCSAGDFDGDNDIDCGDWASFRFVWTDSGNPPPLSECATVSVPGDDTWLRRTSLSLASPNPMGRSARIGCSIGVPGRIVLRVCDVSGRVVRVLIDETKDAGEYSAVWDGTNDRGERVGHGVFFFQLEAPGYKSSEKIVIK